jgi:orotate phosphoribosyltransferase
VQALKDAGVEVLGMVCIFNYGFDVAEKNFASAQVPLVSLSDYNHLLNFALKQNYITDEDVISLKAWRVDPANWRKS